MGFSVPTTSRTDSDTVPAATLKMIPAYGLFRERELPHTGNGLAATRHRAGCPSHRERCARASARPPASDDHVMPGRRQRIWRTMTSLLAGLVFSRRVRTCSSATTPARLPQALRMKVRTSATSWSDIWLRSEGIR
jgi:hypothetical protein